ncbi:MAG: redox-sensing transcriptional repressor Rex [Christensenellaceae bacterium]|nr:redox-sensing transcriptional repressor Rex [Christensenellaceae bacterium]
MNNISDAVIKRLPSYYRHLEKMLKEGITHISSYDLGKRMGLTPSQIRQDINIFGGAGRQGYGYPVQDLLEHIAKIIGITKTQNMIIIGAGNIGGAIVGYSSFIDSGFKTLAMFDVSEEKIGKKIKGVIVEPVSKLGEFLNNNDVKIAVIACPENQAQSIADILVSNNIKAIWNFAPIDLILPDSVVCVNVHLSESLQQLSFRLNNLI